MLSIREIVSEKWASALSALEKACFSSAWSAEEYAGIIKNPAYSIYGVWNGEFLAAYIVVFHLDGSLEILNIGTHPAWRKRGLATRLLRHLADRVCPEKGVRRMFLEVNVNNISALRLYHATGFRETGRRRGYYLPQNDDALLLEWNGDAPKGAFARAAPKRPLPSRSLSHMKTIIAANWKMFLTPRQSVRWAYAFLRQLHERQMPQDREILIFPSFLSLDPLGQIFSHSPCQIGGQNCFPAQEGPFTGETSPRMLRSAGCSWVLLGHSERRALGESEEFIARKVAAALEEDLRVLLCIGETREEREKGDVARVLENQLARSLAGCEALRPERLAIAYEPVWAIGAGCAATVEDVARTHADIRGILRKICPPAASAMRILYGGSVKPENAAALLEIEDVNGLLVGGASLDPQAFLNIIFA